MRDFKLDLGRKVRDFGPYRTAPASIASGPIRRVLCRLGFHSLDLDYIEVHDVYGDVWHHRCSCGKTSTVIDDDVFD